MDNNNKFRIRHLQFSRIYINEKNFQFSVLNLNFEYLNFQQQKYFFSCRNFLCLKKLAKNVFFYVISFEILLQIFI